MFLYNTLTRKKEEFIPIDKEEIKIYVCGPTVYDYIHIGNARPLCVFDVLRNYLEYMGYNVKFVQNFTDIDDKIINRAKEENTDYLTVSERFIKEFKKDSKGLNIRVANINPRATENIETMIAIIKELIKKEHAYILDGDVYFRVKTFKNYGKLSGQKTEELEFGIKTENQSKEDLLDFALWKASKENEPSWSSPWGKGRPGWHIECSAMVLKFLGKTIDLHCGGRDLIFPHHENEIAQSECYNRTKFCNYWLHNGHVNIDNMKMSKSLGNFLTVRKISEKYGYEVIRYLMISSHYRSPINFSTENIKSCLNSLKKLYNFKENLIFARKNRSSENGKSISEEVENYKILFLDAMNDDLNTPEALAVIFKIVKKINIFLSEEDATFSMESVDNVLNMFNELVGILGIMYKDQKIKLDEKKVNSLLKEREIARKNKNWEKADEIRNVLKENNITIEDTAQGVNVKMFEN
ncbi:MAG: cysteine--tRNA ligase [Candidatus Improbicoccus pseudotrichonymphae]|uniref:Cysteine--tRNA ligase n=1 Tax=Candidatus Improbicoccus pseudotrichonymphae TaxID=3033792 RepID=A0AA48HXY5_9FIRM|nr:MAG: cysteine--tRNA ligase [Candidatus Improbicoccus pseudotrichonymphae]